MVTGPNFPPGGNPDLNARASKCPERDQLIQFLLGQLPESSIDPIERHVEKCEICGETLGGLRLEDTQLFRSLAGQSSTATSEDQLVVDGLVRQFRAWTAPDSVGEFDELATGRSTRLPDHAELEAWLKRQLPPAQAADEFARLGTFVLRRILGCGGMGVVFEADDVALRRKVAVKILRPELAISQAARNKFLREAQSAASIEDENVVAIHYVGDDGGIPFLAMPYLRGMTLEEYLITHKDIDLEAVLWIAQKAAAGLAAAHRQGVIHRDIKPKNIFLVHRTLGEGGAGNAPRDEPITPQNFAVKLLDFGLAQVVSGAEESTQSATWAGTPSYMSPEQALGHFVDARSDLFSLGCVLYRLSTGVLPFGNRNKAASLVAVVESNPRPPHVVNPQLPRALSNIIVKLLEKDPARRYACAEEVIQDLERVRVSAGLAKKHRGWRSWLAIAAGVLCLLAMATIVHVLTNKGVLVLEVSEPDVKVMIDDGSIQLNSPRDTIELKVGDHELSVTKDGFTTYTKRFELRRGEKIELIARLEPLEREVSVEVSSLQNWTATGVKVDNGFELLIKATGSVEAAPDSDTREYYHLVPPAGRSERLEHFPERMLPGLALIGRIGDGPSFYVGEELSFVVKATDRQGELYLGINDDIVDDNAGAWKVTIKTSRSR